MKKISIFIFSLMIILSVPSSVLAWNSSTILNNGDPTNRLNIVFVGDGYQDTELGAYATDVQNTLDYLLAEPPFSEYASYINAYRVDVISTDSGTDHPMDDIYVNTALDSSFNWNELASGIFTLDGERCLFANSAKVTAAAADSPVPATQGMVFVVVNDTQYGGCGGPFATFSTNAASDEIAVHELGHSFGQLADEYWTNGTTYTGGELNQANVTIQTVRNNIKWNAWINATTPVPTTTTTNGVAGLYEGGFYNQFGVFRPTFNSKMRALNRPFEQVNSEQLVKRIYNSVSPVDSATPPAGTVTVSGASQTFNLNIMTPSTHSLNVQWYLNNTLVGSGASYTVSSSSLSGNDTLRADVNDPTNLVRNDPASVLSETVTWNVQSSATGPAEMLTPTPGSTLTNSNVTFTWSTTNVNNWLYVGTTGAGSSNVFNKSQTGQTQATVTIVPNGNPIYVRLWSYLNGGWQFRDYVYQTNTPAVMVSPVPGSTISTTVVTFKWTTGTSDRNLWVGTTLGAFNVYKGLHFGDTEATVGAIPLTGSPLYVRLWSWVNNSWQYRDYVYQTSIPTRSTMLTPIPGSSITTSSVTFNWITGQNVTNNWLYVGTTGTGSRNIYNKSQGTNTGVTVNNIPRTLGTTLYVRLWSYRSGWFYEDYTYTIR